MSTGTNASFLYTAEDAYPAGFLYMLFHGWEAGAGQGALPIFGAVQQVDGYVGGSQAQAMYLGNTLIWSRS